MRLMLATTAAAVWVAAPAQAQTDLAPITSCTPGRVWVWDGSAIVPATLTGPGAQPGNCIVLIDESLMGGPVEGPMGAISAVRPPPAPDPRIVELGRMASLAPAQEAEMRELAKVNKANARVFFSRYALTVGDSTIVIELCNGDWQSALCKRANEQFGAATAQRFRDIDARNAAEAAAERAARASSEPVNSGFYSSGAGSVSGAYRPSSGATTTPAPVKVQSESDIRRDQARCRAGSGPC